MTAIAFVAAGVFDSTVFGGLAALHFAIFAIAFGVFTHTGSPTAPATYPLAVAIAALGLAFVGDLWRREKIGMPYAWLAALAAFGSALAGVALSTESAQEIFGSAWPYGVAALAAGALLAGRSYGALGAVLCGAIFTVVPSSEALIHHKSLPYLLVAVALGFAVILAAFTAPRLGRDTSTQAAWVLVGLTSAVTAPSLLFVIKCWDEDGLDALSSPDGIYLMLVVAVSVALVATSYLFGKRARKKSVYQLVELAALAQIFGTFTFESLAHRKDAFYPLAVLVVGGACLAVGATTRRATLVLLASGALLVNLAIQYFAKLWDLFPASLLVLVFGLLLLALGVLYERRLKHLLPGLRDWG